MIFFFFTFLHLNQEHGVNNERSQSIQSVRHSKRTHRMWPRQKDRSTQKKKKKKKKKEEEEEETFFFKVFLANSAHLAVQYNRSMPESLILSQTSNFSTEIMDSLLCQ